MAFDPSLTNEMLSAMKDAYLSRQKADHLRKMDVLLTVNRWLLELVVSHETLNNSTVLTRNVLTIDAATRNDLIDNNVGSVLAAGGSAGRRAITAITGLWVEIESLSIMYYCVVTDLIKITSLSTQAL